MIYLKHTSESQTLFIPKNGRKDVWKVLFRLKSTINQSYEVSQDVIVDGSLNDYYRIQVCLPEGIPSGEYEYTLSNAADILSTGLLMIGDMEIMVEYENTTEYEQLKY